jgi:hypothetical protein
MTIYLKLDSQYTIHKQTYSTNSIIIVLSSLLATRLIMTSLLAERLKDYSTKVFFQGSRHRRLLARSTLSSRLVTPPRALSLGASMSRRRRAIIGSLSWGAIILGACSWRRLLGLEPWSTLLLSCIHYHNRLSR